MFTDDSTWKLIDLLLNPDYNNGEHILVKHQIESFNQFINTGLNKILTSSENIFYIKQINDKIYRNKLIFESPQITDPVEDNENFTLMTPNIARTRNLTYASRLYVQVKQVLEIVGKNNTIETHIIDIEKIQLTKLPIMVGSNICLLNRMKDSKYASNECKYDMGGYFIINGGEKVIIPQEKMIDNKIMVFLKKDQSKYIPIAEVKSITDNSITQTVTMKLKKNGIITISSPQFRDKSEIPLVILLKALGLTTDKDIINFITFNNTTNKKLYYKLLPSIKKQYYYVENENSLKINNQDVALRELIKYVRKIYKNNDSIIDDNKIEYLKVILGKEFIPHMKVSLLGKAYYLCYMANKLLNTAIGEYPYDDRDNNSNKRLDLAAPLLSYIFRQSLKKLIIECGKNFKKKIGNRDKFIYDTPSIISYIKPNIIEKDIKSVLLTGSWGIQTTKGRKGVAQVLKRLTYLDMLSYLRRIKSPTGDSESANKMIAPRLLTNSSYGIICPVETPEGQPVGLVKHLAMSTNITINMESQNSIILDLIKDDYIKLENMTSPELLNNTKLFLNGSFLGVSSDGYDIYIKLKQARMTFIIEKTISISYNFMRKEIYIYTDGGRFYRPLLVVENNKLNITNQMIEEMDLSNLTSTTSFYNFILKNPNTIEFVDIEESQYILIASNQNKLQQNNSTLIKKYTHCEIHPSLILGVVASSIPFSDHNQSPRNTYQCAQARQAMGIYATNFRSRMITLGYILYYPQRPIVMTKMMNYVNFCKLPAGQSVIVAIACYSGFNQEDSLIFNQSAIDRGLFRSTFYRKYDDTIHKNPSTSKKDIFTKPNSRITSNMKLLNYDKLQENGFPKEETHITSNDIIIGKISPNLESDVTENAYSDCSKSIRINEKGIVDKVISGIYNGDDYEICKISIRSERTPTIGDKYSSRGGQKGTIGITLKQEDMPFTKDGVIPDLIINPHCIPSRMTIGQILETLTGKVGAIEGNYIDGTPFNDINLDYFKEKLESYGFKNDGCEQLRGGMTGKILNSEIFIGPTYYQKLKHMVEDKLHSRSTGPNTKLTHQPTEGRSRDGGLRCGEMERDCLIGHGASCFLKERLYDSSDPYRVPICNNCGLICRNIKNKNVLKCDICDNTKTIYYVNIPYAFKLLVQELQSIHITPRFILDN